MHGYQPLSIIGFHSCDRETGLRILNGDDDLRASTNPWDWLGEGIYFWEQNPMRALEYAKESAEKKQFNKIPIHIPFVLGAIIELGNCLNLVEAESLSLLSDSYEGLSQLIREAGEPMPINKGNNRALDCSLIEFIHQSNREKGVQEFDSVRSAFSEGSETYPGSSFTSRLHIQVCIRNPDCIKGFFLPKPISDFNPYLK